jgi:hypothetical protein
MLGLSPLANPGAVLDLLLASAESVVTHTEASKVHTQLDIVDTLCPSTLTWLAGAPLSVQGKLVTAAFPALKQRFTFLLPNNLELEAALDASKVRQALALKPYPPPRGSASHVG